MANYTSGYTGAQVDSVLDLFVGKGLGSITGVVSRKSDGTFEVGAAGVSTLDIAADSGTSALDMAANTKYKLTVGDKTFIFKTPSGGTYTAGAGLTLDGTQFKHSNSVTAQTTAKLVPVKYDAQGHITGVGSEVTSLPASDVSDWAKAASKPTYTASEVGLGNVGNYKAVSTVANQGLTDTEKSNSRANIGAGTSNLAIGTTSSTAAAGNHTHDYSNTYAAKSHGHVVADISDFPESMPASDVYDWAKAASKPSYTYSEVGAAASSHAHGNITSGGDITATAPTVASGDQLVINDDSASKVTNGPSFDGSTTTKALTPKGTWETFLTEHQSLAGYVPTSRTVNSKALTGNITLGASDVGAIATTDKGANGGVAELDSSGKVPTSQLPSFVSDVLEYASKSNFPTTGEAAKIYVAKDTNLTYRWSGTAYVEISPSLALGETSATAYRGDRGLIAYNHSQATHARTDATKVESSSTNGHITIDGTDTTVYTHPGSGTNPHGTTASDVGLGSVGNFKAVSTVANQGLSTTEQSNARANIGAGTSSLTIGTTSTTAAAGNHTHDYSSTYAAKSHQHDLSMASTTGTADVTLASATTYTLTAGGKTYNFKMPTIPTVDYPVTSVAGKTGAVTLTSSDVGLGNVGNFKAVSTAASQGLTDTEKSNARANIGAGTSSLAIGTTASTAAAGNHTHDYSSTYAAKSHSHGNITDGGDITATAPTIASGDCIVINDDSASKITNGPAFDGSTTTQALTKAGTWATFGTSNLAIGTTATTAAAGNHTHSGYASSTHDHGNITSGGDITATAPTIASGDQLVINDSSASKITNGPTFDGTTTTKALTPKGTWETFASGAMPSSAASHTTGISISAHTTGSAITSASVSGTTLTFGTGTVVTGSSHSITDNGHTHTLS